MSFYTITLAELFPKVSRSRVNDILVMTLGVVVNGRDQGYYALTAPVFPGSPYSPKGLRDAASINGYPPPTKANSRHHFEIGPIEVDESDHVEIVYSGINVKDDPSIVTRQNTEKIITSTVSGIYYWMLGAPGGIYSALGLAGAAGIIPKLVPDDLLPDGLKKFIEDPVGYVLGLERSGPCNGVVYKDALHFTGKTLSELPFEERPHDSRLKCAPKRARVTSSYTDADSHNTDNCGAVAKTDVSIEITEHPVFSLAAWEPKARAFGSRPQKLHEHYSGGRFNETVTFKDIVGLRN